MKHFNSLLIAAAFLVIASQQVNAQVAVADHAVSSFYTKPQLGPNPAHSFFKISWQQATSGNVLMQLFRQDGTLVATLVNQNYPAGNNARSISLAGIPRGTFTFRLQIPGQTWSTTLVSQ